jgi:DNA mismatch repair protein MutS2
MSNWDQAVAKLDFAKVIRRAARYAASDPGREVLEAAAIRTSREEISEALAKVSEAKGLLVDDEQLPLEGIHPVREALSRSNLEGMTLSARELLHIAQTLRAGRLVRTFLTSRQERAPLLWSLGAGLLVDKILEFNIDRAIDETASVRASASKELLAVRQAIADRGEELRKRLAGILRTVADQGFSQDEIITTREGRMVIPVKVEHKHQVPGFIHSASASGATVFIEPTETLELNNDIRGLQFQEQREVERILRDLTLQVRERSAALAASLTVLAELDALQSKAKYSVEIIGTEPDVTDGGPVRILDARHPLLLISHGREKTVPLDLEVGGKWTTLLISGPNAGGKSVAMKCVGLLTLMAQAGMHVPAGEGTSLRLFQSCFVDIGDEQSIENDLSTFSSHLANLKNIAEQADERSLVLIDEIGSGTDPSEGGALAAALLEDLTRRRAVTIATTHQGFLKVFAHDTPGVANGAMAFDQTTLTPTYRFYPGVPGSSYALEMASRSGFSTELMKRARELLGHKQIKLDALIAQLEEATKNAQDEAATASAERSRLDLLVKDYESKIAGLSAEIRQLKKDAVEEARGIVERANALIERAVKEIRESQADQASVRRIRDEVESLRSDMSRKAQALAPPDDTESQSGPFEVGSAVRIGSNPDAGEIAQISADRKTAVVVFGAVKIRVPVADLRPARNPRRATVRAGRPAVNEYPEGDVLERHSSISQNLDVRGMTGDEALPLVDKFIDDAILAGLHRIDIIHGKGTGSLRKRVSDFLASHPRVKSYRLGEWNEGGLGVTVVELGDD